jgi:hypothetical protein
MGRAEIVGYHLFCGLVDPAKGFTRVYVMGYGMSGPWVYP